MKKSSSGLNKDTPAFVFSSRGRHSIPAAATLITEPPPHSKPVDCTAGEATAAQHAGRRATRTPEALGCVDAGDARVHLNNYEWPPTTTESGPGAVAPARAHADA